MLDPISITVFASVARDISIISSIAGGAYGIFKVISWVKGKFVSIDNNVVELKNSMDNHITGLREDIKTQTAILASALSEQRADFRTFYAPTLLLMQQAQQSLYQPPAPIRAKRAPRKK
jgi:hypothetical protein